MSDFCDFLKGFESSEAFTAKLVDAVRGGLPSEVRAFRTIVEDESDNDEPPMKKPAILTYKLKEVSQSFDPREKYVYECDDVEHVPSKNAAKLKAEIMGYELLDLHDDEDDKPFPSNMTKYRTYMSVEEYYSAERIV